MDRNYIFGCVLHIWVGCTTYNTKLNWTELKQPHLQFKCFSMDSPVICWPTYQVQRAPFTHLLGQHLFPITKFSHFPHRNVFSYSTKEKSSIHLKWVWNPSRILLAPDCKNPVEIKMLRHPVLFLSLLMLHLSPYSTKEKRTSVLRIYNDSTLFLHWWWPHFFLSQ